jgi:hypothetical protein
MVTKNWHAGCNQRFMPGSHRRKQETVMRYTDSRDPYEKPSPLGRFGSWLSRRSIESWGFFIAGFLIARIFF